MMEFQKPVTALRTDAAMLAGLASVLLVLHLVIGNGYGFHRDELQFLDDARHLAWGYVAYPPVTAFMGRLAIALFGISVESFRLPATLAAMANLVLTGLTARELGARRGGQAIALGAALGSQVILGSLMLYVVWDYLAWTLVCFCLARLLRTQDGRWWLAVGASVGLGVLSKYTIGFMAVSVLAGVVLLAGERHWLRSRWLYLGLLVAALIALPNLLWEARHGWVTLDMLSKIHARDVRVGRAKGFLPDQLQYTMIGAVLAGAGLWALLRAQRFRLLAIFYLGPLLLFLLAKGRGYYLLPGYTPLYAAGAVWLEQVLARQTVALRRGAYVAAALLFASGAGVISWMMLPGARPGSSWYAYQMRTSSDMRDETGWPEMVAQVAAVRDTLPQEQRARLGILASNYGEAGALALYGPLHGLPVPISTVNSFHARGYGAYEPETVIAVGEDPKELQSLFESCSVAGYLKPVHGQHLWDTEDGPILVCHRLKGSWPEVWKKHQSFG